LNPKCLNISYRLASITGSKQYLHRCWHIPESSVEARG
jgi:hypothetical protein